MSKIVLKINYNTTLRFVGGSLQIYVNDFCKESFTYSKKYEKEILNYIKDTYNKSINRKIFSRKLASLNIL